MLPARLTTAVSAAGVNAALMLGLCVLVCVCGCVHILHAFWKPCSVFALCSWSTALTYYAWQLLMSHLRAFCYISQYILNEWYDISFTLHGARSFIKNVCIKTIFYILSVILKYMCCIYSLYNIQIFFIWIWMFNYFLMFIIEYQNLFIYNIKTFENV